MSTDPALKPKRKRTEQEKEVENDISNFKAIEAVVNQDGGKIIVSGLQKDIIGSIETICASDKLSDMELRIAVIKLRTNLSMLRLLKRAPKNRVMAEEELIRLLEE